jgi:hypothetical protein
VDQGELGGTGTSACKWTKLTTNDEGGYVIGIAVRPAQGISDVSPNPNHPEATVSRAKTTGGRQAAILRNNEGSGSCAVSIAVGSGRIDIDGQTLRGTTEDACAIDSKLSDYIEPKLPAA